MMLDFPLSNLTFDFPLSNLTLSLSNPQNMNSNIYMAWCLYQITIVPKIKEIQKVVQKLSREQRSAAAGGASGGVRTGTKT